MSPSYAGRFAGSHGEFQRKSVTLDTATKEIVRIDFGGCHDIDGTAENGGEIVIEAEDIEERCTRSKFDEQVQIGVGPIVAAGDRTEQPDIGDRVPTEYRMEFGSIPV